MVCLDEFLLQYGLRLLCRERLRIRFRRTIVRLKLLAQKVTKFFTSLICQTRLDQQPSVVLDYKSRQKCYLYLRCVAVLHHSQRQVLHDPIQSLNV